MSLQISLQFFSYFTHYKMKTCKQNTLQMLRWILSMRWQINAATHNLLSIDDFLINGIRYHREVVRSKLYRKQYFIVHLFRAKRVFFSSFQAIAKHDDAYLSVFVLSLLSHSSEKKTISPSIHIIFYCEHFT